MSDILRLAKKYVLGHYGNLISVDDPIYDSYTERWVINVKSNYPRIIVDDKNNERIVNTITLNKLCKLYYSSEGKLLKAASKGECISSLRELLNIWRENIERIITKASAYNLSNVETIRFFLRPIKVIIYFIHYNGRLPNDEIKNFTRPIAYMDWIDLLERLKIIEKHDEGYIFGDYGVGLREKYMNDVNEILNYVISYTLSERYSYINEIMKLRQFGTIIHTNSCYYRSCIEADKIIRKTPKSIFNDYVKYYGQKSYPEIFHTLIELANGKVLEYDKPYISANEIIFEKINEYSIDLSVTPPI